jgi:ribosomal protein L9
MKVTLLKDVRIMHKAGETVEVSPAEYNFLTATKSARPAAAQEPKPAKTAKPRKASGAWVSSWGVRAQSEGRRAS